MLLAYRRGLLMPDYPNGLQSILRERMILNMLDYELMSEHIRDNTYLLNTVYSPHYDTSKLQGVHDRIVSQLDKSYRLRTYDIHYLERAAREVSESNESMAKAFTTLKERGILKAFSQHVNKVLKKLNK